MIDDGTSTPDFTVLFRESSPAHGVKSMNCDSCTTANPQEAVFCIGCGSRLSGEVIAKTTVASPSRPGADMRVSPTGKDLFIVLGLLGLLGVLGVCVCLWRQHAARERGESLPVAQTSQTVPAASRPSHHAFGGGYRDAKWGMDKPSVKAILAREGLLPGRPDFEVAREQEYRESGESIQVWHEGKTSDADTIYWFSHGKLFSVLYRPNLSTLSDTRDVEALVALLTSKCGTPVHTNDAADEAVVKGFWWPTDFFDWSDGETAVRLVAKVKREDTLVRYTSVALQSETGMSRSLLSAPERRLR